MAESKAYKFSKIGFTTECFVTRPLVCREQTLRGKCANSKFFWSIFSHIWFEYEDLENSKFRKLQVSTF